MKLPEGPHPLYYEGVIVGTFKYREDPNDETAILIDATFDEGTPISEFLKASSSTEISILGVELGGEK